MSRKYLIRITELERLLSEQAEALRQKDQQLSLVEETEAFLRSALARAEEKIRRGGAGNRTSEGPDRKTAPDVVRYPF